MVVGLYHLHRLGRGRGRGTGVFRNPPIRARASSTELLAALGFDARTGGPPDDEDEREKKNESVDVCWKLAWVGRA